MRRSPVKPEILYEDNDIIVCRKPANIAVQTAALSSGDLVSVLKNHLYRQARKASTPQKGEPYLAVIHRLDQPVEGLLVFGKTKKAASDLSRQLQKDHFGKYYKAVIQGFAPMDEGELCDYLVKDGKTNLSRVCTPSTPGAKKASLHYRVLSKKEEKGVTLSLLEIHLHTGRHHQIRVQLAHAGCPLLGDRKYNPTGLCVSGLALCACRLEFLHPVTKELMRFETEPQSPSFEFPIF